MKTHIAIINQILEISKPFVEELGKKELERKITKLHSDNKYIEQQKALSNPRYLYTNIVPFVEGMFDKYIIIFKETVVYDMIRSLSKNCEATDKLVGEIELTSYGTVEISCVIEREGIQHNYRTSLISAGGYNIQCYHFRYITKTTLGASKDPKWLDRQLRTEELQNNINNYRLRIEKEKELLAEKELKSDEENALEWYIRANHWKLRHSEEVTSLPEEENTPSKIKKYVKLNKARPYTEIASLEKEIAREEAKITKLQNK